MPHLPGFRTFFVNPSRPTLSRVWFHGSRTVTPHGRDRMVTVPSSRRRRHPITRALHIAWALRRAHTQRGEDHRSPGESQGGDTPDRILTSHAGSLPRPEDLITLNERRTADGFTEEAQYLGRLRAAVADVVARQRETGIDLVNDGEFGHSIGMKV